MTHRPVTGSRPPAFPKKATLAAELDMSERTVDEYVARGLLPKPNRRGGSVRWCWAEVEAAMLAAVESAEDPFMTGVKNVT